MPFDSVVHPARCATAALIASMTFASAAAHAQNALWKNDWMVDAPAVFNNNLQRAAFSPDGELVYTLNHQDDRHADHELIRLLGTESVRWAVSIPLPYSDYISALPLPLADGGSLVNADDGEGTHYVARIDAQGGIVWTRNIGADSLEVLDAQLVAAASCGTVTALNAANGVPVWQYATKNATTPCYESGLAADGAGHLYATYQSGYNAGQNLFHVVKLDAAGQVLWDIVDSSPDFGSISIAQSDNVYFVSTGGVRAYRASDGTPAFALQGPGSRLLVTQNSNEPVMVQSNGLISRLDPATGAARWQQQLTATAPGLASVVGGDVIVSDGNAMSRLAFADGNVIWSTDLPKTAPFNSYYFFASGQFGSNTVGVAGSINNQVPFVARIDFASGNLIDANELPNLPQDVQDSAFMPDTTHLIAAGYSQGFPLPDIQVRQLDVATGNEQWRTTIPADTYPSIAGFASTANEVIVSAQENNAFYGSTYGVAWIGAFDRSTGNLRWQNKYYELFQQATGVSAPAVDPNGDIFVSYAASVPCDPNQPSGFFCSKHMLLKLSGNDGSELWHLDTPQPNQGDYPTQFVLIGSNVLVSGPFVHGPEQTGSELWSGADGSTIWTSTLYADFGAGLNVFPNGDLVATRVVNNSGGWAGMDPATGSVLWQNSEQAPVCTRTCYYYASVHTPGDGVLIVGEGDGHPQLTLLPGAPNSSSLHWNPDPAPAATYVRSLALQALSDSGDNVWLKLSRDIRTTPASMGFSVLARLDLASGNLLSQQVVTQFLDDYASPNAYVQFLAAPENSRVPVSLYDEQVPKPTTSALALYDTTVTAHGDLSIRLNVDHATVVAGKMINFHIYATYTGDVAIDGAMVVAYVPWAGAQDVACSTSSGRNCTLDVRSGNIRAVTDLMPNETIDVSGSIRVLAGPETNVMAAYVVGPIGLSEANTLNNLTQAKLIESLFADGFE